MTGKSATYAKIERKLSRLERRLLDELGRRLQNAGNTSADLPSELLDLASDGELDYMSVVSAESGSDMVQDVQRALEKLHEGTYGTCDDCGGKISQRRLRARPFATLCISCKEQREQLEAAGVPHDYARIAELTEPEDAEQTGSDVDSQMEQIMHQLDHLELNEIT